MRWFLIAIGAIAFAYLATMLYLYVRQRALLYHPTPPIEAAYPSIAIENDGVRLHAYVLHPGKENAVIYFGGNAENAVDAAEELQSVLKETTIYIPEYRGYGHSEGEPSEAALTSDAKAWYDAVAAKHRHIAVAGRSLGTGVAVSLAAHRKIRALVLITPYDSIAATAAEHYPLPGVSYLVKDRFDSCRLAPDIEVPTLVLVAENDRVVSAKRSDALIGCFRRAPLTVRRFEGRGHGSISQDPAYYPIIEAFILRHFK